ncbi:MAG: hypothetical protein ABI423_03535 [Burkholderiales bacterium]
MRAGTIVGFAMTVWFSTLWAQAPQARDPLATRGGWELGLQAAAYRYEEPKFALWKGNRVGATGSYTMLWPQYVYSRIEMRYSYGALDYTGSGTLSGVPDHLYELRAIIGQDFRAGRVIWSPYVGVAYRQLYDDLRGTSSTGARGYRRKSEYWYLPAGVTLRLPLGAEWILAPQIEYDAFANGRQRSYLADAGLGFSDVVNRQERGYGARAQLMLERRRWSFGLWAQYWKIKDSDIQPIGFGFVGLEPANNTRESGIELRYRF